MKKIAIWFVCCLLYVNTCLSLQLEIGNGDDAGQHLPCDPFYSHSSCQLIYNNSYFDVACTINQLSFNYNLVSENPETYINDITIMIGEADITSYEDEDDYVDLNDLEVCFEGNLTANNFQAINSEGDGWMVINLDNPFYYSSSENLIIFFLENNSNHGINSDNFISFTTNQTTSMCFIDDINPLDINNLVPAMFIRNKLPNTIFDITIDDNYPLLILPENNSSQIALNTTFTVQINNPENMTLTLQGNFTDNLIDCNDYLVVDENMYEITPLLPLSPNTYYTWQVTSTNDDITYSSSPNNFTTTDQALGIDLVTSNISDYSVTLEWTNLFDNQYPYHLYKNGEFITSQTDNCYLDNDVQVGETYYYKLKFFFIDNTYLESNNLQVNINLEGQVILDENFESYEAFSTDLGNWQNIDNDASLTYALADYDYPNAGNQTAFITFSPSLTSPPLEIDISGQQCLASFAAITPPTSDILISPDFQASQLQIDIFAKSINTAWGMERLKIAVIYNNDIDNPFNLNAGNYLEIPETMTQFSFSNTANQDDIITNLLLESCGVQTLMLMIERLVIKSNSTSNDNQATELVQPLIYPNPIRNNQIKIYNSRNLIKIKLYNLKGQLVFQQKLVGKNDSIALPKEIPSGIYLVKASSSGQDFTQKISIIK